MIFIYFIAMLVTAESGNMSIQELAGGHSITIPSDISVKINRPVEDFTLYSFSIKNDKPLLVLYIGNQPNFHEDVTSEKSGENSILPIKSTHWITDDGLANGDLLFKLADCNCWPMYAHFSYRDATIYDKEIIDRIVKGFHVKNK